MFTDLDKNKEMLLGSYKKLKSYYHYNKNFVFMKKKIAELKDLNVLIQLLENSYKSNIIIANYVLNRAYLIDLSKVR